MAEKVVEPADTMVLEGESTIELGSLHLALVGGGIGDTIL